MTRHSSREDRPTSTSIPWDAGLRDQMQAHVERMEGAGERVMAAASRDLDPDGFDPDGDLLGYVTGLRLASLVGMVDPPRQESAAAVAAAQAAHIRVRMVTGDDVITGAAIAKRLGIDGEAILGADFAALPESDQLARIDGVGVVGRVAPEHKVLLANTLKKKGHVVAMTGDGVNDAPAIKAADIGIAMGSGTEVAKNAGRMVLSDDNFATIVFAVEQGRMGFDKATLGLMALHPRRRGQSVLTTGMLTTVGAAGLAITIGLLSMIAVGQHLFGSVPVGQSIAFTCFALCLIVAAVECRSESETALTTATFDSKQMNRTMLGEFVLAVLVTQMDVFNRLLGTTQINLREFGWALVPAIALLIVWELGKYAARRRMAGSSSAG
ncbi:MAG TPA: HAD-IC family P-type ATPase [Trebonia sp.]